MSIFNRHYTMSPIMTHASTMRDVTTTRKKQRLVRQMREKARRVVSIIMDNGGQVTNMVIILDYDADTEEEE